MINQSFFLIRPCAFDKREEIKEMIVENGLIIKATKIIWLTEDDICNIYGKEYPSSYYNACLYFLRKGFAETGVVEGENAIKLLLKICGRECAPSKCSKNTIRRKFGKFDPVVFEDQEYYFNPIHRSRDISEARKEVDYFWKFFLERSAMNIVYDSVRSVYQTESLDYIFDYHIRPTIQIADDLCDESGADKEIVKLALLLHDVTRIKGGNHHITGAENARFMLRLLGYEEKIIGHVSDCILTHRGSKNLSPKTVEAEIVASADGIAHIKYIPLLFYHSYGKKELDFFDGLKSIKLKIDQSYAKVSDFAKKEINKEYEKSQKMFSLFIQE